MFIMVYYSNEPARAAFGRVTREPRDGDARDGRRPRRAPRVERARAWGARVRDARVSVCTPATPGPALKGGALDSSPKADTINLD